MALYDLDYDDVPDDVRHDTEMQWRRDRWRCPACGGGIGRHNQFCPEGDPEWATDPADDY